MSLTSEGEVFARMGMAPNKIECVVDLGLCDTYVKIFI